MISLVSLKGLSEILNVSESTIYYWVERNEIPFLKVGKHLRFIVDDVLRFYAEKTLQSKADCHRDRGRVNIEGSRSLATGASARTRNFASQKEE